MPFLVPLLPPSPAPSTPKQATQVFFGHAYWHPEPVRALKTNSQIAEFAQLIRQHRTSPHVDTSPDVPLRRRTALASRPHSSSPDLPLLAQRSRVPANRYRSRRSPSPSPPPSPSSSSSADEYLPDEPVPLPNTPRTPSPVAPAPDELADAPEPLQEFYGRPALLSSHRCVRC